LSFPVNVRYGVSMDPHWSFEQVGDLELVHPGLLVPSTLIVTRFAYPTAESDVTIVATWAEPLHRYDVTHINVFGASSEYGRGITSETLRKVAVQSLLREAIAQVVSDEDGDRAPRFRGLVPVESGVSRMIGVSAILPPASATEMLGLAEHDVARLKESGPTSETLQWVARVYRVGQIWAEPPAKTVRDAFALPASTATYWIKQARGRGILDGDDG